MIFLVIAFSILTAASVTVSLLLIREYKKKLAQIKANIRETDKMKSEFIQSISHELRTPLTAIKGWGETLMLTKTTDAEMLGKGLFAIVKETDRLSKMVEELLDFSRIQKGNQRAFTESIDLIAEINDVILVYAAKAAREKKRILFDEPVFIPLIRGSKSKIRQVFTNILDNAIKYCDAGGVISIKTEIKKDSVSVSFADNGCGIAKEDLPRIQEKFFRANTNKRGTGIGLSVVHDIIESFGGTIHVESTKGVGTTVIVILPIEGDMRYEK